MSSGEADDSSKDGADIAAFFKSDSIEDYIQTTGSHVESANQELAKASHYQRQLRKRKCYLLIAGVLILTLLIIIIALSARK